MELRTEVIDRVLAEAATKRALPSHRERRRIREAAGVSQAALALAMNVSGGTISRWEVDQTPRNPATIARYVEILQRLAHARTEAPPIEGAIPVGPRARRAPVA